MITGTGAGKLINFRQVSDQQMADKQVLLCGVFSTIHLIFLGNESRVFEQVAIIQGSDV